MDPRDLHYLLFKTSTGFTVECVFDNEGEPRAILDEFRQAQAALSKKSELTIGPPIRFDALNGAFIVQPAAFGLVQYCTGKQSLANSLDVARFGRLRDEEVKKDEGSTLGFGRAVIGGPQP